MLIMLFGSLGLLVFPSYIAMVWLGAGIYTGWTIGSAYIILISLMFLFRFRGGKWKSMRVIEEVPPFSSPTVPENPLAEYEL
jgi:MATE family multidrug resistance protein